MANGEDSLDIFVRIHSDTAGAKQAQMAMGELNNVIRASPADVAKATAATSELEAKHRDLHGAVRAIRREIPLMGEAMHAGLLGPITAIALAVETFNELRKHIASLHDDMIKVFSDESIERMGRFRQASLNIADATRKAAEQDAKWHLQLVTNHEEMVQKLEVQLGRIKALQESAKQTSDIARELAEAQIKHQEELGLLSPEAGIAARAKAESDAVKDELKSKQDANAAARKETERTLGMESITERLAQANLTKFETRTPDLERKREEEKIRQEGITKRAGNIDAIDAVVRGIEADVENIDGSKLDPGLQKKTGETKQHWKHRLQQALGGNPGQGFGNGLREVQDEDIRQGKTAAAQISLFDTEKDQAKQQAEAAHKNAENLRQRLKNIDTDSEVLSREAGASQKRSQLIATKELGELSKTPGGGLLEHAAVDEMIVMHQRDRTKRGLKGQVYDATTGTWRNARRGEAPTALNEGQQGELNSAMGGLNAISAKDQNDILNALHLKRTPGKDFGTLVMEALTMTMGNVEKHTALLQQLIAQARSHSANIDSLNTTH
jgi:hypothetical protein